MTDADTSWTRERVVALRNEAMARAQMCAPIVQEAEELDALISSLDEVLGGVSTPHADALLARAPVTSATYDDPHATVNATTQTRVLAFVREEAPKTVRAQDVASTLGLTKSVARVMLSRLFVGELIERAARGEYRASQR